MTTSKVVSFEEAVAAIPDGAVVAASSSSCLNTPDRTLQALGDRFRATGRPRGLTLVLPISSSSGGMTSACGTSAPTRTA